MENYEILHKVGSGALGITYKVRHKRTGDVFAMKCISRGDKIDEFVTREIMNHRKFRHPNVIEFKEVVLDDTKLGIVMEFAKEGDLSDKILLNGAFGEAEARKMFQKLIAGVSYIHSKGVCHGHLKLDNILLTPDGGLKICNFYLPKLSSLHSSMLGTPAYIAPEVWTPNYDGKLADVWSCGVALRSMLTRDFPSQNYPDDQLEKLPHVSEECNHLLSSILVGNPTKRITIEQIKKHPWYLKDLPADLTEEAQAVHRNSENVTISGQNENDINNIIEAAKSIIPPSMEIDAQAKTSTAAQGDH